MDPFNKLPDELRFRLLISLGSLAEAATAAQASRALLHQLRGSKASIIRRYALRDGDLDGDLIQDAVAIIKFPRSDAAVADVDAHLRKWGAKELLDPFQLTTRDIPTMLDVHTLCRQMRLYIGDYLSKATSRYLPRAYRRLPQWSCFSRLVQDVDQFDPTSLGDADRRRILQAFLRYELLCKIYGPVAEAAAGKSDSKHNQEDGYDYDDDYDYDNHYDYDHHHKYGNDLDEDDDDDYNHNRYGWGKGDQPNGYQFHEDYPFRYWDWSILYRYEKREPEDAELQLLPCVREYVLATYGALIADQIQAPVPVAVAGEHPKYENAPSSGSGRFPDYNPDNESEDLYRLGGTGWSDAPVSLMATVGFDLLTTTLASSADDFIKFLVDFNKEVLNKPPLIDATNVYLPISAPSRRRRISWHCNDYIRLHRQRAWALFHDSCQGPQPRIPHVDEYRGVYGPGPVDGLVGWGLEMDDTRNEWIAHGQGAMAYSSLAPKMVPFWERRVAQQFFDVG
ncbi:hypothetical protein N0V84_001030 [Fusarium piperis]|uniref:Uncharacterized protein n=1 Tax=Fusarium piperis TaxID=1435070 RepID=A0A9W8WLR1_9HYPO|nr:hypothetical protein N0V84_001030 [Fusarium piperis]